MSARTNIPFIAVMTAVDVVAVNEKSSQLLGGNEPFEYK